MPRSSGRSGLVGRRRLPLRAGPRRAARRKVRGGRLELEMRLVYVRELDVEGLQQDMK